MYRETVALGRGVAPQIKAAEATMNLAVPLIKVKECEASVVSVGALARSF